MSDDERAALRNAVAERLAPIGGASLLPDEQDRYLSQADFVLSAPEVVMLLTLREWTEKLADEWNHEARRLTEEGEPGVADWWTAFADDLCRALREDR